MRFPAILWVAVAALLTTMTIGPDPIIKILWMSSRRGTAWFSSVYNPARGVRRASFHSNRIRKSTFINLGRSCRGVRQTL